MSRKTYEEWSRALSFVLMATGWLGIIFVTIFWAVTTRLEPAFLPFFGTIAGVGHGLGVLKEISESKGGRRDDAQDPA